METKLPNLISTGMWTPNLGTYTSPESTPLSIKDLDGLFKEGVPLVPTAAVPEEEPPVLLTNEKQAEELLKKKTICLCLTLRRMGTRRKVSSSTDAIATDTDRDLLLINKIIIDSPELEAIIALDAKIRAEVKKRALPADLPMRGCYLFATSAVPVVDERLVELKTERDKLVDAYVTAYPSRIEEAKGRLGKLFDPSNYISPEYVKSTFRMEWSYPEPVKVSSTLREISNSIFHREVSKMGEKCQEMLQQVEEGLVSCMEEFVDHLISSLSVNDDGKPKVFKVSSIQNFTEFLDQLPNMNITGSKALEELGKKAKEIMSGADAKILRKDMTVREALQDKLKDLKNTDLKPLIQEKPGRKIKSLGLSNSDGPCPSSISEQNLF